jgi:excisionase family DNA binding protein
MPCQSSIVVYSLLAVDDILTRADAAKHLRLSLRQVDRLIAEWAIPVMRLGSSVRIRLRDLEKWVDEMTHPLGVQEVSLELGIAPESVLALTHKGGLPHEKRGSTVVFFAPLLQRWRSGIEPRDRVFVNIDDRATCLRDELASRGVVVELLLCTICRTKDCAQVNVAGRACILCGRPVCLPHSLHYIRNGKAIDLRPDVACDDCHRQYMPATWNG